MATNLFIYCWDSFGVTIFTRLLSPQEGTNCWYVLYFKCLSDCIVHKLALNSEHVLNNA